MAVLLVLGRRRRLEARAALVEHADALLDAAERLLDVRAQAIEHRDRVVVGAAPDVVGIEVGVFDHPPALLLGGLGESPLLDEECGLLLGAGDDALRFLLGLLDDPLALGVDPLRRADLLGHRHAQLIDEVEGPLPIDDDTLRQGQGLAVRDQRLQPLDEEDDVDRTDLHAQSAPPERRRRIIAPRAVERSRRCRRRRPARWPRQRGRNASSDAGGTIPLTSPPKRAISLTRLELMYATSSEVMRHSVSTSGASFALLCASESSTSKSVRPRRPRTIPVAPTRRQRSTVRPSNVVTSIPAGPMGSSANACADDRDALVGSQQRDLARVLEDRDDQPVDEARRAADDVDMAVGERVEGARVDRDLHYAPRPPSVRR